MGSESLVIDLILVTSTLFFTKRSVSLMLATPSASAHPQRHSLASQRKEKNLNSPYCS
jgi:hypothetical protein